MEIYYFRQRFFTRGQYFLYELPESGGFFAHLVYGVCLYIALWNTSSIIIPIARFLLVPTSENVSSMIL